MSKSRTASKWVKEAVHKRDKVCQSCGTKGSRRNKLTVHHKKARRDYPELIDDPENCELLCENCHRQLEQGGLT